MLSLNVDSVLLLAHLFGIVKVSIENMFPEKPNPYGMYQEQEQDLPSQETEECFSVIMAADIQYPWTDPLLTGDKKTVSKKFIKTYFASMSKLMTSESECAVKAVIVNGDLTASGLDDELTTLKELLSDAKTKLNVPIYLGLGEHDYVSNIDANENRDCSSRMVRFMTLDLLRKVPIIAYENLDIWVEDRSDNNTEKICNGTRIPFDILFNGSMAYSFDIHQIHFVQLQNYPTYHAEWQSNMYASGNTTCRVRGTETFKIRSSLNWLENDLRNAAATGKFVIICFHDPNENFPLDDDARRFRMLITKYHVAGVFVGHYRKKHGIYSQDSERYGNVPVFAIGSARYGTFLQVTFKPDAQIMKVQGYMSVKDGEAKKVKIRSDTIDFALKS